MRQRVRMSMWPLLFTLGITTATVVGVAAQGGSSTNILLITERHICTPFHCYHSKVKGKLCNNGVKCIMVVFPANIGLQLKISSYSWIYTQTKLDWFRAVMFSGSVYSCTVIFCDLYCFLNQCQDRTVV